MNNKLRTLASPLLVGVAAMAIGATPSAVADERRCSDGGGATRCQSPGNAEIHVEPPQVSAPRIFVPYPSQIQVRSD